MFINLISLINPQSWGTSRPIIVQAEDRTPEFLPATTLNREPYILNAQKRTPQIPTLNPQNPNP